MDFFFEAIDHKISSRKIFPGTSLILLVLIALALLAELLIDLPSTTPEIMFFFASLGFVVTLLSFRFPDSRIFRVSLIIFVYAIIETHFLLHPTTFHTVIYWIPFVPLTALITMGQFAFAFWCAVVIVGHVANFCVLLYSGNDQNSPSQEAAFFVSGFIFLAGFLTAFYLLYMLLSHAYSKMKEKNTELLELKSKVEAKKELLEKYQRNLLLLVKEDSSQNGGAENLFRKICTTAVNTLSISRVSIWLLEEENNKISRRYIYTLDQETSEHPVMHRKDYPDYFKIIESKNYIMADNAREHSATKAFKYSYLIPNDIYSLLDCPIVIDRAITGIICCENQYDIRQWNTEDVLFVQSLADFIAINFKSEKIRALLDEVRIQNQKLIGKNEEIEVMNEKLTSLNRELTSMNDTLEIAVKTRTHELEAQNKQLTEYAFINSHQLRAPLSRILGLTHLISKEVTSTSESELVQALLKSSNELDSVVRQISEMLYGGNKST
jgi:hypothetical protein